MGICEGFARSILPDHMGRADYHGASINQAARFMDAAAHGGQIACEEALALRVMSRWTEGEGEGMDQLGSLEEGGGGEGDPNGPNGSLPSPVQSHSALLPSGPNGVTPSNENLESRLPPAALEGGHLPRAEEQSRGETKGAGDPHPLLLARLQSSQRSTSTDGNQGVNSAAVPEDRAVVQGYRNSPSAKIQTSSARVAEGEDLFALPTREAGWVEISALHLGRFRFKGSEEPQAMVNVTPSSLKQRGYPNDPPKGKGGRIQATAGVAATCKAPLLPVVNSFKASFLAFTKEEEEQGCLEDEQQTQPGLFRRLATLDMRPTSKPSR